MFEPGRHRRSVDDRGSFDACRAAVRRRSRLGGNRCLGWARAVSILTGFVALVGVAVHVWQNYEAAPLDFRYTASWPTTAEPIRWLLAATDTVGPNPTLAPAALAFVCICLFLATVGHPALDARPEGV